MITCPVCKHVLDDMGYPQVKCPYCGTIIDTHLNAGEPQQPQVTPPQHQEPPGYYAPPQNNNYAPGQQPPAPQPPGPSPAPWPQYYPPRPQMPAYIAPHGYYQGSNRIDHAGLGKRFVAWLIDTIIITLINLPIVLFTMGFSMFTPSPMMSEPTNIGLIVSSLISILISLGYFIFMEGYFHRTIGKMAMGIIVVGEDLQPVSWKKSLIRNGLRILYNIPLLGAIIYIVDAILISQDEQRIGDKVAHTFVIEKDFFDYLSHSRQNAQPHY